jgi:hypothetical protein
LFALHWRNDGIKSFIQLHAGIIRLFGRYISGVFNLIKKQHQMQDDICITAKKIVAFNYFIDGVVFVKDLDGN